MSDNSPNVEAIPDALRERRQWMLWDASNDAPRRPGGWDPESEKIDWYGSWKNPSDWLTFDEAIDAAGTKDSIGVGFVFCELDDYVAIDLDGCLRSDDGPKEWCPSLDPFLGETYIERSPSGDGVHIVCESRQGLPEWWSDKHFDDSEHEGIEAYDAKFVTITGELLFAERSDDCPGDIPGEYALSGVGAIDDDELRAWLAVASEAVAGEDPRQAYSGPADRATATARNTGGSDVPDLSVHDVFSGIPEGKRVSHPVHGSGTGANFSVDEGGETWRCWRHEATGNAYHLLGIDAGLIDCGEWSSGSLGSDTWREIFDEARERGLIPDETQRAREALDEIENGMSEDTQTATDGGESPDELAQEAEDRAIEAIGTREEIGAIQHFTDALGALVAAGLDKRIADAHAQAVGDKSTKFTRGPVKDMVKEAIADAGENADGDGEYRRPFDEVLTDDLEKVVVSATDDHRTDTSYQWHMRGGHVMETSITKDGKKLHYSWSGFADLYFDETGEIVTAPDESLQEGSEWTGFIRELINERREDIKGPSPRSMAVDVIRSRIRGKEAHQELTRESLTREWRAYVNGDPDADDPGDRPTGVWVGNKFVRQHAKDHDISERALSNELVAQGAGVDFVDGMAKTEYIDGERIRCWVFDPDFAMPQKEPGQELDEIGSVWGIDDESEPGASSLSEDREESEVPTERGTRSTFATGNGRID